MIEYYHSFILITMMQMFFLISDWHFQWPPNWAMKYLKHSVVSVLAVGPLFPVISQQVRCSFFSLLNFFSFIIILRILFESFCFAWAFDIRCKWAQWFHYLDVKDVGWGWNEWSDLFRICYTIPGDIGGYLFCWIRFVYLFSDLS